MMFVNGVSTTATSGRLFVIDRQSLCVYEDARIPSGLAGDAIFLGTLDGVPCFARSLDDGGAAPPERTKPVALRALFGALTEEEFAVAGRALALTAWDRDHRHCGRCAAPTRRSMTERARVCVRETCKLEAYPRLSPAVIVLVEKGGRALLARNARTRMPFFSTLAGFVEVGETLEECVAREIREEAGIEVCDVRYFGSQPWPLGGSLMVGFTARWSAGEVTPDPSEIAEADWFAPDALPEIPPKLSIARVLIDDFVRRCRGDRP
jgi:NAD+ diphosphatase